MKICIFSDVLWAQFRIFDNSGEWTRRFYSYVFAFAFTLLHISFYAGFRSSASRPYYLGSLTVDTLKWQLNNDHKILILPGHDFMKSEEKLLLFGTENLENDPRVELCNDRELAFKRVCENDKYLMYRSHFDTIGVNMYPCSLRMWVLYIGSCKNCFSTLQNTVCGTEIEIVLGSGNLLLHLCICSLYLVVFL